MNCYSCKKNIFYSVCTNAFCESNCSTEIRNPDKFKTGHGIRKENSDEHKLNTLKDSHYLSQQNYLTLSKPQFDQHIFYLPSKY